MLVTPQQFLLWDLEPNRIKGKLYLQIISGSFVMIIVHSKSEVTLQKNLLHDKKHVERGGDR